VRGVLTAPPVQAGLATLAITTFLAGLVLYAAVAALLIGRLLRGQLAAPDITPPYWISMGGASITVFAALQLSSVTSAPVAGLAVLLWVLATCLIPLLLAAGVWRHAVRGVPLGYRLELWTIVFPLGMYAMAGLRLGTSELPAVRPLAELAVWPALTAWTLVILSMAAAALRKRAGASSAPSSAVASNSRRYRVSHRPADPPAATAQPPGPGRPNSHRTDVGTPRRRARPTQPRSAAPSGHAYSWARTISARVRDTDW